MSNYIDNGRFEYLILNYSKLKDLERDELMDLFDLLISNIIDSFHFKVEKEDAKQDCFVLILRTLKNFNSSNGRAFNYFTTIIINNLKLIFSKNKKYNEKISLYFENKYGIFPVTGISSL